MTETFIGPNSAQPNRATPVINPAVTSPVVIVLPPVKARIREMTGLRERDQQHQQKGQQDGRKQRKRLDKGQQRRCQDNIESNRAWWYLLLRVFDWHGVFRVVAYVVIAPFVRAVYCLSSP